MVLVFVVHRYKNYAKLTKQSYRELHIIGQISKCFWQKHVEISKCYALNVPQKHNEPAIVSKADFGYYQTAI